MNILITGAGGFLGKCLAKSLLDKGHRVSNFSRNEHPELDQMGVRTITGDLSVKRDVIRALSGFDAVFHMASKVGMWGSYEDFYETNVLGTQNLITACRIHQVNKIIYTSSPSVVFGKKSIEGADESLSYPREYISHYAKTKALAEQEIIHANNSTFNTVSLRPHLIFGPGDPHIFPKLIQRAREGKLKQVGDGKNIVDVIYVQNAVDAHILALEKLCNEKMKGEVAGKSFFLAQEKSVNLWEFINQILTGHGVNKVKRKVPAFIAYGVGSFLEGVYNFFSIKSEPAMTRFVALQLSKSHYFDHTAAREKLGYTPKIELNEALELSIQSH